MAKKAQTALNLTHVWVVLGADREYSDGDTWAVAAYPEEAEARRHAEVANQRLEEIKDDHQKRLREAGVDEDVDTETVRKIRDFELDRVWVDGVCHERYDREIGQYVIDRQRLYDHPPSLWPKYTVQKVPLALHVDQYQDVQAVEEPAPGLS